MFYIPLDIFRNVYASAQSQRISSNSHNSKGSGVKTRHMLLWRFFRHPMLKS